MRISLDRNRIGNTWRILIFALAVAAASKPADAGLTLVSSSATVKYSLYNTSGAAGSPVFDSTGLLITPGGGFPILDGVTPGNPTQTGSGPLSPALVVQSVTGDSGNSVPPAFGTAATAIFAQGAGQQGPVTTQGGIFWGTATRLMDGLQPADVGLASVSYSTATSTFTNNTAAAISINPGALLSVQGTVGGSAGSYVAAGLASSFELSGSPTEVVNAGIVLAANAAGLTFGSAGTHPGDAIAIRYDDNRLFATGNSSFLSRPVSVGVGQSITISATLTLISDPMSEISISSGLAPGFPPVATLPDFGAFAGGTPFSAAVPEPATIVMLALGMAIAGACRIRARGPGPGAG